MSKRRGVFVVVFFMMSGCATARVSSSHRRGLFDSPRSSTPPVSKALLRISPELSQIDPPAKMSDPTPFSWPLRSIHVTSAYGPRGKKFHEGVDLRASRGTPVYAVRSGSVIYSDQKIRGYGKMIVIRHDNGISSVYAHHSKNLVKKGARVRQGQLIAASGGSGFSKGDHLHFEIRQGLAPLDPMNYLSAPPVLLAKASRPAARLSSGEGRRGSFKSRPFAAQRSSRKS